MNEELTSNYIKNDEPPFSKDELDYKNLITKLEDIKSTIVLLEKAILK